MAFIVNGTPTSYAEALYSIKATQLKSIICRTANGKITTSSNGTVYAAQGDVINGAADLATPGAWYVHQFLCFTDIDVRYATELCVQHDGSGGLRVKISHRSGFAGGAPGLLQTPSAADEVYWLGGGTDASPTYAPFLKAPSFRLQAFFSEENESQFVLFYPVGGGPAAALWFIDRPCPNPKGAGGNLLDKERIVFYAATGANCALAQGIAEDSAAPRSMFAYGESVLLWGRCPPQVDCKYHSGTLTKTLPGACSTSSIYGFPTVPERPFCYRRDASLAGVALAGEVGDNNTVDEKGTSQLFRFGGQTKTTPTLLDGVDPVTGQSRPQSTLAIGDVLLVWNSTPILL